ncbi:diiron oxygenase [Micromonospora tulbaghiae]|uniref:diiron oxygenase n=1 Tax=Micromonospora tulbaghiae TaxID=479978 RepID=UPI0033E13323
MADRLSRISRENRYDVYTLFEWPSSLPADRYWISPELMTCYGTELWDELDEPCRVELSHREAVNFFSVNVHLIRELIGGVAERIYTTRYPGLSEFFHDFIAEENVHAWFFATFCQRYGGGVYPARRVELGRPPVEDVLRDVVVFGRILIAEELSDYFNATMANDERLPEICQQINRVHHEDESRHIAFGRQMMRELRDEATRQVGADRIAETGGYLARYSDFCLQSLYSRQAYAQAGLERPGDVRSRLLSHPRRAELHRAAVGRTVGFLNRIGLVDAESVPW